MLVKREGNSFFLVVCQTILILVLFAFILPSMIFADGYASTIGAQDSLSKYVDFVRKTIIGRYGLRFELDKTGYPISITGNLSNGLTEKDPVKVVYEFIEKNKDIYKIENPSKELVLTSLINDGVVGPTVKMSWTIKGVKVGGTGFNAQFSNKSGMYEIEGHVNTEAYNINTTPAISEEQAKSIAIQDMEKVKVDWPENAQTLVKNTTLMIARFNGELKLAWGLGVQKGYDGYGYWIDAQTGKIIESGSSAIR
jgi:Zn-dependent metalloprotease